MVVHLEPDRVAVGSEIVVAEDGRSRLWRVMTVEPRLLEAPIDRQASSTVCGS